MKKRIVCKLIEVDWKTIDKSKTKQRGYVTEVEVQLELCCYSNCHHCKKLQILPSLRQTLVFKLIYIL